MTSSRQTEKDILERISRDRLWQDTQTIGAEYRRSGSNAEASAVDYITRELKDSGVEDVTVYELNAYVSYHVSARCEVLSPERREIPSVVQAYTEPTPPEGLDVELVLPDEYDGDLSDKAVLTARDWPGGNRINDALVQIHVQTTNEPNLHRGGGTGVWGTPTAANAHLLKPKNPAINISRPDGEALRDMVRQGTVRVRLHTDVETGWRRIRFPVAWIPGAEDTFVLTGGHLDSHDPGVTDNATGCASLLELARVFSQHRDQLRHGLAVGWWTGHESAGYAGSTWFNDQNWEALHERCILYWNNDGPGIRDATNVESRYTFPQTQQFVLGLIREFFGRDPEIIAKPLKMGDQSFWGVGVPSAAVYRCLPPDHPDWAVVFGAGHGNWWHSTADTLDKADPDFLAEDTRFYATALYRLCTADMLPFEFVTYGTWMEDTLLDLQSAAGSQIDLSELMERTRKLKGLAAELEKTAASLIESDQAGRQRVNACLMRLSRALNPVFFTAAGLYDQDLRGTIPGPTVRYPLPDEPAFEPRYFPGLQQVRKLGGLEAGSTAYNALYTTVLRERNRVAHGLSQARDEIIATLSEIT
jgi:N-acetylated-alpha-linked acidic dipeptidase